MILDVHGEMLDAWLERYTFRDGPACEGAAPLEAKVVVQASRLVALDDEDGLIAALFRSEGLGSAILVALAAVFP